MEGELQRCQQMLNDLESKSPAKEEVDGQEANKDKLDKDLDNAFVKNDVMATPIPGRFIYVGKLASYTQASRL